MAKVLSFKQTHRKKNDPGNADLGQLLKKSSSILKDKTEGFMEEFGIIGAKNIKPFFERRINKEIFAQNLLERDILLCGIYVSNLLAELAFSAPESWWAVDYYTLESSSMANKKGGDACFIICGVFPQRGSYRDMDIAYYRKMGETFYFRFYGASKKEIGYHMSRQFDTMAAVVQRTLRNFQETASQ